MSYYRDPFLTYLAEIARDTAQLSPPIQNRLAEQIAMQMRAGDNLDARLQTKGLNLPERVRSLRQAQDLLVRSMYPAVLPLAAQAEQLGGDFTKAFHAGVSQIMERLPGYDIKKGQFWSYSIRTGAVGGIATEARIGKEEWGLYGPSENPGVGLVKAQGDIGGDWVKAVSKSIGEGTLKTPFYVRMGGDVLSGPGLGIAAENLVGKTIGDIGVTLGKDVVWSAKTSVPSNARRLVLDQWTLSQLAPSLYANMEGADHHFKNVPGFERLATYLENYGMNLVTGSGPGMTAPTVEVSPDWIKNLKANVPNRLPTPFFEDPNNVNARTATPRMHDAGVYGGSFFPQYEETGPSPINISEKSGVEITKLRPEFIETADASVYGGSFFPEHPTPEGVDSTVMKSDQFYMNKAQINEYISIFEMEQAGVRHPAMDRPEYPMIRDYLKGYSDEQAGMLNAKFVGEVGATNDVINQADYVLADRGKPLPAMAIDAEHAGISINDVTERAKAYRRGSGFEPVYNPNPEYPYIQPPRGVPQGVQVQFGNKLHEWYAGQLASELDPKIMPELVWSPNYNEETWEVGYKYAPGYRHVDQVHGPWGMAIESSKAQPTGSQSMGGYDEWVDPGQLAISSPSEEQLLRQNQIERATGYIRELSPEAGFLVRVSEEQVLTGGIEPGAVHRFPGTPEEEYKLALKEASSNRSQNLLIEGKVRRETAANIEALGAQAKADKLAEYGYTTEPTKVRRVGTERGYTYQLNQPSAPEAPPLVDEPPGGFMVEDYVPQKFDTPPDAVGTGPLPFDKRSSGAKAWIQKNVPEFAQIYLGSGTDYLESEMYTPGPEDPKGWFRWQEEMDPKTRRIFQAGYDILRAEADLLGEKHGASRLSTYSTWVREEGGWRGRNYQLIPPTGFDNEVKPNAASVVEAADKIRDPAGRYKIPKKFLGGFGMNILPNSTRNVDYRPTLPRPTWDKKPPDRSGPAEGKNMPANPSIDDINEMMREAQSDSRPPNERQSAYIGPDIAPGMQEYGGMAMSRDMANEFMSRGITGGQVSAMTTRGAETALGLYKKITEGATAAEINSIVQKETGTAPLTDKTQGGPMWNKDSTRFSSFPNAHSRESFDRPGQDAVNYVQDHWAGGSASALAEGGYRDPEFVKGMISRRAASLTFKHAAGAFTKPDEQFDKISGNIVNEAGKITTSRQQLVQAASLAGTSVQQAQIGQAPSDPKDLMATTVKRFDDAIEAHYQKGLKQFEGSPEAAQSWRRIRNIASQIGKTAITGTAATVSGVTSADVKGAAYDNIKVGGQDIWQDWMEKDPELGLKVQEMGGLDAIQKIGAKTVLSTKLGGYQFDPRGGGFGGLGAGGAGGGGGGMWNGPIGQAMYGAYIGKRMWGMTMQPWMQAMEEYGELEGALGPITRGEFDPAGPGGMAGRQSRAQQWMGQGAESMFGFSSDMGSMMSDTGPVGGQLAATGVAAGTAMVLGQIVPKFAGMFGMEMNAATTATAGGIGGILASGIAGAGLGLAAVNLGGRDS